MTDYVLVHGGDMAADTWNALVGSEVYPPGSTLGGRVWDPIVAGLEERGDRAFAPTLGDEHTTDLTAHVAQVAAVLDDRDLHDVVLAGHSYGGMVITGVAAALPRRVRRLVYVDAAVPEPGQSLFDLIEQGGVDPLSFPGLEAAPPYVEQLHFDAEAWRGIPKRYLRCAQSDFAMVTRVVLERIAADPDGWECHELPTGHVPMATVPDALLELLTRP